MEKQIDEVSLMKKKIAKDIIGEIVLSDNPELVIKKWRTIFKISQKDLANELGITPSVVSDYESGRRASPGIKLIKKYIMSLLDIDEKCGGNVIRTFSNNSNSSPLSSAILDIKEFANGIDINTFCKKINASFITKNVDYSKQIYGYTVIDSLKAITEFSSNELIKLYGLTTQRALIFTKVSTGRSPMIALKLTNLRPNLVVLHGLVNVDEVAKRIAEVEKIPLVVSMMKDPEEIIQNLRNIE